ncbi:MAG TPA: galactose oxidase-like domain-containing protein [Pyrinomonadaceae bacterium]|nr:galactose oxidase-like domain-containing protein [Pyrinomonadaceae bacterium]
MKVSMLSMSRRRLFSLLTLLLIVLAVFVWSPFARKSVAAKAAKAPAPLPQSTNPGLVGQWSGLIDFKTVPLHISLLPNGKLLYWGRDKETNPSTLKLEDVTGHSNTYVVDPQFFFNDPLGHTATFPNITTNLFCSGHSFLADGRLMVAGGHEKAASSPFTEGLGERAINFFDYTNPTNPWSKHSVGMALGRWYPYNVTLANGNVVILGGYYWTNRATPSQVPLTELNPGPERYTYVPGGQGSLAMYQQDQNPYPRVDIYPLSHLAPNGRVLLVGLLTRYFDPSDTSPNPMGHFLHYPYSWGSFTPGNSRYTASSALYDVSGGNGKVLVVGGNAALGGMPVNEAHTNVTAVEQDWTTVGSMAYKRKLHTATILPDGKVLVSGGQQCPGGNNLTCPDFPTPTSGGAVINPELWNPNVPGVWTTMAPSPSAIPRLYHSIALLLPDATVLVGAGGLPGAVGEVPDPFDNNGRGFGHKDAEIFSPPYLFNLDGTPAQRPTITWLQDDKIGLGQSMLVKTPDYANISSVVLVRLGSVTHGFNQDQRRVALTFSNNNLAYPQTLNVTMPATGNICPPGPYMMFLMNANGTPSVAKMVSIQVDPQIIDPTPSLCNTVKSGPAVARNSDGRLQAFYRGGDDALCTVAQTTSGGAWGTPVSLGGAIFADPVVIKGNTGLLEVLVVGGNNGIYYTRQTAPSSAGFTSFTQLSGSSLSPLSVYPNADGRLQAFYRGTNNAVWTIVQSTVGTNAWGASVSLGDSTMDPPAAGRINGSLVVFIRGTSDNWLHYNLQTLPNGTTWNGFGNVIGPIQSAPTVGNNGDGSLAVFARGPATDLLTVTLSPPEKRMWFSVSLGGSMILSPGLGANTDTHLDVFVLGGDQRLYNNYQTKEGWNGFALLGGSFSTPLNTPPVTALNANGKLAVFVRGSDNSLYTTTQTVSGGSGAYSAFSRITPAP